MLYAVVRYEVRRVVYESEDSYSSEQYCDDARVDFQIVGLFRSRERAEALVESLGSGFQVQEVASDL